MKQLLTTLAAASVFATGALGYDIRPQEPESGFPENFDPDIIGMKVGGTMDAAIDAFETRFPDAHVTKQVFGFPETDVSFLSMFSAKVPGQVTQNTERLSVLGSTPASGNVATVVQRTMVFPQDAQPEVTAIADSLLAKYGVPSAVDGFGTWIWTFSDGQRRGLPEDVVSSVMFDNEALTALPVGAGPLEMYAELDCARRSSIWGSRDIYQIMSVARSYPCDAFLYAKINPNFQHPGRASGLTIAAADFTLMKSADEIDRAALQEAEEERRSAQPVGVSPDL